MVLLAFSLVAMVFAVGGCAADEGTTDEPTSDVTKGGTFNFYISEPAFKIGRAHV